MHLDSSVPQYLFILFTVVLLGTTVVFNVHPPSTCHAPSLSVIYSRIISPSTTSEFLNAYIAAPSIPWIESAPPSADPVELISTFNSVCSNIMDSIAPYKTKEKRPNVQPWLNEQTRALKQECRRAERKWKNIFP